jgi:hypothetical protein
MALGAKTQHVKPSKRQNAKLPFPLTRKASFVSRTQKVRHGRTTPRCHTIKLSNYMETPTHTAPPVALDRHVLHLHAGQQFAECPHCKGQLSKKTPIMKGDENEEVRGRHGAIVAMRMATDARPKCPHCYGRFELVIHVQNVKDQPTSGA